MSDSIQDLFPESLQRVLHADKDEKNYAVSPDPKGNGKTDWRRLALLMDIIKSFRP
jgi:hypothetical protein